MRRGDLPCLLLKQEGSGSVKHPGSSPGKSRRVPLRVDPVSGRLHSQQPHVRVFDKRMEHSDRVRSTAHACQDEIGEFSRSLQHLGARLAADDRLEVPDDRRERIRSDGRPHKVVGRPDVRHPVPHSLVDSVFQSPGTALNGDHLSPEHFHPEDVQGLPFHVRGPHVHDALHLKLGAGGCRCDPVLPGPSLCDDPVLAKPLRQERLGDGVVDLVGAGVVEVLSLEPDSGALGLVLEVLLRVGREPVRQVQRGRAPDVGVERGALPDELRVVLHLGVHPFEFFQRLHQGLRDVPPPELPEPVLRLPGLELGLHFLLLLLLLLLRRRRRRLGGRRGPLRPRIDALPPGEALAELAQMRLPPALGGLLNRLYDRAPDDDAVALFPRVFELGLGADAEAYGDWELRILLDALQELGQARVVLLPGARDSGDRDGVHEGIGMGEEQLDAVLGGRRRDERDVAQPLGRGRHLEGGRLLGRQVDDDEPVDPGLPAVPHQFRLAVHQERVVVAHQHERRADPLLPCSLHQVEALVHRGHAVVQGHLIRSLDGGPVCKRVREGNPEFDHVGPALLEAFDHIERLGFCWEAQSRVRDERGPPGEFARGERLEDRPGPVPVRAERAGLRIPRGLLVGAHLVLWRSGERGPPHALRLVRESEARRSLGGQGTAGSGGEARVCPRPCPRPCPRG
mmetsp:Transcript_22518/g.54919  ORF Transcript_22518/g.54919 Transcript_22518/m.54919 type:complete len:681 (+) Transcript_22518:351-2393(+)